MRVQKVENLVSLYVWHTSLTLTFLSEKVAAMLYNPLSFSLSQELFMAETKPQCSLNLELSQNLQTTNAGEGVEQKEPSYTVGGNVN